MQRRNRRSDCGANLRVEYTKQEKKRKITDKFLELRNHEISLVLSRHLYMYESETLHELIGEVFASLQSVEDDVERTLDSLETDFKPQLLARIDVRLTHLFVFA